MYVGTSFDSGLCGGREGGEGVLFIFFIFLGTLFFFLFLFVLIIVNFYLSFCMFFLVVKKICCSKLFFGFYGFV